MIFFTDENISEYATRMLEAFDRRNELRAHIDWFEKGTADTTWMQAIAVWDPKPVVVCGDGRILKNASEKRVLRECDLMYVYLAPGWTNLSWEDFAWKIIKAWPSIVSNVGKVRRPRYSRSSREP